MSIAVDYSLLRRRVPPIAGPGSETFGIPTGASWCGYCGFTGRVAGPVQRSCPERHGWHGWLRKLADDETFWPWWTASRSARER